MLTSRCDFEVSCRSRHSRLTQIGLQSFDTDNLRWWSTTNQPMSLLLHSRLLPFQFLFSRQHSSLICWCDWSILILWYRSYIRAVSSFPRDFSMIGSSVSLNWCLSSFVLSLECVYRWMTFFVISYYFVSGRAPLISNLKYFHLMRLFHASSESIIVEWFLVYGWDITASLLGLVSFV